MSVGLRLDLRQSQQLVMTPQLQQAIKLLQMSNYDLVEFVEGEVEKNPLLRIDGREGEAPRAAASQAEAGPADADSRAEDHSLAEDTFDTGAENLHEAAPRDTDPLVSRGGPGHGGRASSGTAWGDETGPSLEERLAQRPSLREHLRAQLGQIRGDGDDRAVALYLVEELDEHGYLRADLDEVADRLGTDQDTVAAGLTLLQGCDPTGVGARDLADCLRLQLHEQRALDGPMACLIDNLDLLARGEARKLRALCGVDDTAFSGMVRRLRRLDPRPCACFDQSEAETLVPDILLRRTEWGGWLVELNTDTLPSVLIDRRYAAEVGGGDCAKARRFLADCHATANWLVKSLDQRSRTIVKVASEIVRQQEAFFERGVSHLRPLTLRAVADAVGMHESTVSRVTANKYIHTHRGIFELKFFFTNAVGGDEGDIAAAAVRHRIKALVDAEAADAVLSDDAIVDTLAREGIEIARRTVAKYRKSLNIPSSVDRRRRKSLGAVL